ncbi:MAG: ADP-ribosylglycohydrolase family protein, partial [Clostridiales bacterium]
MKGLHDNLVQDPITLFNENTVIPAYPVEGITTADRIIGAIMGTFIGDALGQSCLWYYDYNDLWKHYGTWLTDYQDPQQDDPANAMAEIAVYKYQAGVRAGMNSQTGQLIQLLLEQVVRDHGFDVEKYAAAVNGFFENEILPTATFADTVVDDTVMNTYYGNGIKCFSGRYTNREVRENFDLWYNSGKKDGLWWKDPLVSTTSTSDGAQMAVILAALYRDPKELFERAYQFLR